MDSLIHRDKTTAEGNYMLLELKILINTARVS